MNNNEIILNNSLELMKNGILEGTGKFIKINEEEKIELPEVIHTYNTWKKLGFQVKKGEKAVASFKIWNMKKKKKEESKEFYLKNSHFFKLSQVERI